MFRNYNGQKLGLAFVGLLVLAGCSKSEKPDLLSQNTVNNATRVAPGSERDFIVNVGDRIYFLVDQTRKCFAGHSVPKKLILELRCYRKALIFHILLF